jgi:hypothetical protein
MEKPSAFQQRVLITPNSLREAVENCLGLETFEVVACSEQDIANHDEPVGVVREEGDIDEFTDETQNDENNRSPENPFLWWCKAHDFLLINYG